MPSDLNRIDVDGVSISPHHYIDGQRVASPHTFEDRSPLDWSHKLADIARGDNTAADLAVSAAAEAFLDWSELGAVGRAQYMNRLAELIDQKVADIARIECLDMAMLQESLELRVIPRGARNFRAYAELALSHEERVWSSNNTDNRILRMPAGPAVVITPWNAPAALALGSLTSALYTGNTVILKPSPYTPLTTLKMGELAQTIFPPGVINVLAAGNELGQRLTEHAGIDKISFTGSVATGKKVMSSSADTLKRVTLELGGNDPAIVLDDADPKAIAKQMFFACFVNSGQVCMAIKRIYAHESVYDELCDALVEEACNAKVGNGLEPDTKLGPLQNKMQFDKVADILSDTKTSGASFLTGGEIPDERGYFIPPTLVTDIDDNSRLVAEEQFGPIVPILKYADTEEALKRANDTCYGLSGSVWTSDLERGKALAERMEVGTAWVNQHRATSAYVPFGGAKQSGLGRQYSILGLKGYMEPQVVSVSKV